MWSRFGPERRTPRTTGLLLGALAILALPVSAIAAPADDEIGPVVTQLEGIRVELKAISGLLQTLEKHQQVTLLMTRIRLKQQRLSRLESQVEEARHEEGYLGEEIEHLEMVEKSYFEDLDGDSFSAEPSNEAQQKELEFMRQQRSNLEARREALRARAIEAENDLMRAREEVLALEETVDKQLGLR